jgi:16S rRNA (uracil1498-N3)-methyltransferase
MPESHSKNLEYFYTSSENISSDRLTISGEEHKHITRVLRKNIGDELLVVDGIGNIFTGKICVIQKDFLECEILKKTVSSNEPNVNIILAVGILKNPSKIDFIIEKATELGVKKIIPLLSEHTIGKSVKTDRWKNLSIAAMKQSLRAYLPVISDCTKFESLAELPADLKLIADIDSSHAQGLKNSEIKDILIAIGPEGGFSNRELDFAVKNHFKLFRLSDMRLRSETAAITAVIKVLEMFQ